MIVVFCLVAGIGTVVENGALAVGCAVIISVYLRRLNLETVYPGALPRCGKCGQGAVHHLILRGRYLHGLSSSMGMAALWQIYTGFTRNPTVVLMICMLILLFSALFWRLM